MGQVICYSIGCPNCKRLEKELQKKEIQFELITNKELMIEKGFKSAPILEVDGTQMGFKDAMNWVKEQ